MLRLYNTIQMFTSNVNGDSSYRSYISGDQSTTSTSCLTSTALYGSTFFISTTPALTTAWRIGRIGVLTNRTPETFVLYSLYTKMPLQPPVFLSKLQILANSIGARDLSVREVTGRQLRQKFNRPAWIGYLHTKKNAGAVIDEIASQRCIR